MKLLNFVKLYDVNRLKRPENNIHTCARADTYKKGQEDARKQYTTEMILMEYK